MPISLRTDFVPNILLFILIWNHLHFYIMYFPYMTQHLWPQISIFKRFSQFVPAFEGVTVSVRLL